jgi:enediyne biosynthesis protein E4
MSHDARRWKRRLLISVVAAGLLWGSWQWSAALHYRKTVAQVEAELEEGLVSRAANHLVELSELSTGSDEVAYLRGVCEKARGRQEAAAEAWATVAPDSAFAFRALEGLVELGLESGRLSNVELLIEKARQDPRFKGQDPSILLGAVYSREGRTREAKQLLEALWHRHNEMGEAASETAINQLWLYIQLQSNPIADETIRAILEHAGEITPDDDRIWLWKANLAIRTKSYAAAGRLLDRCQARRPENATVWRARLDWAVATDRVPLAREALKHLPAAGSTLAEIENLTA